ncbi:hypothetical protein [Bacillus sp. B-jedd]|uniref:hypothetical protein n=1 Tax=Bacillus sp. B-jedd TaxID=1476857 RepID=UPI0005157149|nr:hypothetical protein [Bacillus sp. B-jedd]CEG29803.1 hypothetical protein BN1002_04764 [Bacillus sp. B-jedd]
MMILEALKPVFINGIVVEVGGKFSCPNDFAEKLVESKSAKPIKEKKKQVD